MLLEMPSDFLQQIESATNIDMRDLPRYCITFVAINTKAISFTDLQLSQTLVFAIDQSAILKSIYGGVRKKLHQLLVSMLLKLKVDQSAVIRSDQTQIAKLLDRSQLGDRY